MTTNTAAVLTYAARLLQDRDGAADITQETFLRAWRDAEILPGSGYVRGWLLTVARNLARPVPRRAGPVQEVSDATIVSGSAGAAPDHADRVAAGRGAQRPERVVRASTARSCTRCTGDNTASPKPPPTSASRPAP